MNGAEREPGRGLFVTFEGVEGSGKSTQISRLAQRLADRGVDCLQTMEPGGTAVGVELRALLLRESTQLIPEVELLLYVADRAQHLRERIEPALARGRLVLCDRYADATMAYQAFGRGLDRGLVRALHRRPPLDRRPDRTLLLDLDPEPALGRARRRNRTGGTTAAEGRFEREDLEFHRRVRRGYLTLAREEPERIRIVDAAGSVESVAERVAEALADLLPELAEVGS